MNMSKQKKSELLMPAGSLDRLKTVILYGADAVYIGTPDMSLRTKSKFTLEDVCEGIEFAHEHGKRVYLTLNLFSHNKDVPKLEQYIETVRKVKPDGLIIADPGVFQYVKKNAPELELHISTQANVCSWLSVQFWEEQGAELCVLAREVSYPELVEIRDKCPDIKLETFIHGAMCMTYSGRCLLSNFMAERGANQGNCANSCRWNYKLHMHLKDGTLKELEITEDNKELFEFFMEEGIRPGEMIPIEEDNRGSYMLNSKDLCMMPKLDEYLKIGIDSLKVEGRNRSLYYLAVVARTYRQAIDDWYEDPDNWEPHKYMREMAKVPNRGYTFAFHEGRLTNHAHNYDDTHTVGSWEFGGIITDIDDNAFYMQVKNTIEAGDVLEFLSPDGMDSVLLRMYEFEDTVKNKVTEVIHAGPKPIIRIPFALFEHEDKANLVTRFPVMTIVRKERPFSKQEWERFTLDKLTQKIEIGEAPESLYKGKVEKLQAAIEEGGGDRNFKSPRLGVGGCCGRGCNGCLIFWHDPSYEKARAILAEKKQGEMLKKRIVNS